MKYMKYILILLFLLISCTNGKLETGRYFCYPPGCQPHENSSYTYFGKVSILQERWTDLENKEIYINVKQKEGNSLLEDHFFVYGSYPEAYITWNVFDTIKISIINENNLDTLICVQYYYSKELIKFTKQ